MNMTYAFAIAFSLIGLGTALWYSRPGPRARAAHRLARKVNLELAAATESVVAARLGLRNRVGGLVAAVGAWVTIGVLAPASTADELGYGPLFVVMGYFVGHAIGYGAVAWYETRQPVPAGPRLARASSPTHDDYVTRLERWGAWGAAGVATTIALAVTVTDRSGVLDLGPVPWGLVVATATLPWLAVLADEYLARRLLDRRQVAASQLELAWDDALRAQTLRDMVTVPIVAGLYLPIALLGQIGDSADGGWPANPIVGLTAGLLMFLFLGGSILALVSIALRPEGHFRTRLWGAADQAEGVR